MLENWDRAGAKVQTAGDAESYDYALAARDLMASVYAKTILGGCPVSTGQHDLERSMYELCMANQALRGRLRELEASNEELVAFAHTVAHDLKAPVCNLAGYADFALNACDSLSTEDLREHLDTIRHSALELDEIINELLLLAELDARKAEPTQLDMSLLVSTALHRLAYKIEEEKVRIILPEKWPSAVGYGPWVAEVWMNYIDNAIKYGGQPPRVELGGEKGQRTCRFWVRDNGRGLSADQQRRLFAPFTQLIQARSKGHGLGLSIVRHIVEKLGGEVGVESELGQGSVFSFTLPARAASHPPGT